MADQALLEQQRCTAAAANPFWLHRRLLWRRSVLLWASGAGCRWLSCMAAVASAGRRPESGAGRRRRVTWPPSGDRPTRPPARRSGDPRKLLTCQAVTGRSVWEEGGIGVLEFKVRPVLQWVPRKEELWQPVHAPLFQLFLHTGEIASCHASHLFRIRLLFGDSEPVLFEMVPLYCCKRRAELFFLAF